MKRPLLLFSSLPLLVAAASCVGVDTVTPEPWVNDPSLPVPVLFSVPGLEMGMEVETKAPVNGESMAGNAIGVYAIKVNDSKVPQIETDGSTAFISNLAVTVPEGGTAAPANQYYPLGGSDNYSFYAYHPYRGGDWAVNDGNRYTINYTNLGYTDIMFAKADAKPYSSPNSGTINGFNGEYIRTIYTENVNVAPEYLPSLEFKHLLTSLQIYVKENDVTYTESGIDIPSYLRVINVRLNNVPASATLCVASETEKEIGTLTPSEATGTIPLSWVENGSSTSSFRNVQLYKDKYTYLSEFLVCEGNDFDVEVYYRVVNEAGTNVLPGDYTANGKLSISGGFKAGTRYEVKLSIIGPAQVKATTKAIDWATGESIEEDLPQPTVTNL